MIKGDVGHSGTIKKSGDAGDLESRTRALDAAEAEKFIHRLPPKERRVRFVALNIQTPLKASYMWCPATRAM